MELQVSTCSSTGYSGDTYLALYLSGNLLEENDDAGYCGHSSTIYFSTGQSITSNCQLYQTRQGCYSSTTCSGTTVVFRTSIPTPNPTYKPSGKPTSQPSLQPSSLP